MCVCGIDIDIIVIIDHVINFYVPSFLDILLFISSFPIALIFPISLFFRFSLFSFLLRFSRVFSHSFFPYFSHSVFTFPIYLFFFYPNW